MRVGLLTLRLRLPAVASIKEKRSIVKRVIAAVERRGPAIAVAEADDLNTRDRTTIRIAHLSNDPRHTESVLMSLCCALELEKDCTVERSEMEIL